MMKKRLLFSLFIIAMASFAMARQNVEIIPKMLSCEDLTNPSVLETRQPRFSWINIAVNDRLKGKEQRAYQIQVATTKEKLLKGKADLWDSGKVLSSDSHLVTYKGQLLHSGQDAFWKVRVWDERDVCSPWSSYASFGIGLNAKDWKANWIGAPWQGEEANKADSVAPMFRKDFIIKGKVKLAKAYITAMGFFELYANGQKVSEDHLVPNFTNFTRRKGLDLPTSNIPISDHFRDYRIMYLAYDVTAQIKKGQNVLGVLLGNGWANPGHRLMASFGSPRFLCQLDITYADGSHEIVITDDSWKVKASPIQKNDIYDGEIFDARLIDPLWASVGCKTHGWQNASIRKAPDGKLTAHDSPTDCIIETLHPLSLKRNEAGEWTVEFDHEISGRIHLRGITGKSGQQLSIQYICESPLGIDKHIFSGNGPEEHAARFTWYVFSKAVISGIDHLTPEMITAECIGTNVPVDGHFYSSDSLLNRINVIWQQSQKDNMHCGVASDCPHRERAPYTGDAQVACPTVLENFNSSAFYRKWVRDMRDTQNVDDGYLPNGAPWQPICGGGVGWGAAMNIMPWELYVHTGDVRVLSDNYFAMKEQLRHMLQSVQPDGTMFQQKKSPDGKSLYWLNLGDWAPPFGLPKDDLVHTFYLWYCAELTAQAGKVLAATDKTYADEANSYQRLADRTKKAFHQKFYNAETESYGDYGSNVFALYMGVPDTVKENVVHTLEHEIADTYKGHLNTGIFGTRFLFEVLFQNGLGELALRVLRQRDFPSYGNWIEQGSSVTWEMWNGEASHNHPMFGGGLVSLYRDLAGIRLDSEYGQAGYKHVTIRPFLSHSLPHIFYEKQTPYGLLKSDISLEGNSYQLTLTIPVGTTATVILPSREPQTLTQGIHTIMY